MEDDKHHVVADGDTDLSFESLTFGDSHNDNNQLDRNGQQGFKKKDKFRKKISNKKEAPHTPEGERSSSVYISTQDDKLDVQALLKRLEHFGAVRGYYFKEKQNFGIVQFVDPSVADAVVESFSNGDSSFKVTVERTSRAKDHHASPHSFGSIPPSLGSTPSSVTSVIPSTPPPEKPDTILVLKNLPFTLKQDQLHEILLSLSTTIPQSISLHYDNGVFRGMAFIKYRQLEDAIQVYELLNGMDVGGRKVRVEYKRKPATKALTDIPAEWQEDEELRRLWEQLKEFKEDANQTEWYYPPTLTNNQRRNIYNMTERLKLVQGNAGDGEVRVLFLRKGPPHSHVTSPDYNNSHSGSVDKNRGMDIKGRRTRHDSDASSRSAAGSPNDRERMGRNSVGRNEGNKHSIATSAPADMNLDWRSNQPNSHQAGSHNSSFNSNLQFAHNMQIHHQQQSQQQQQALLAPLRQPKGPDGSRGFDAPRKPTPSCAFLLPSNTTAEVSAS